MSPLILLSFLVGYFFILMLISFLTSKNSSDNSSFFIANRNSLWYLVAFGMIGTLIGLVQMLASLEDPTTIGPSMAVALLTTFYGAVFANLVFIPIAGKLKNRSQEETLFRQIAMEGILMIQEGLNPRYIEPNLARYLAPKMRTSISTSDAGAPAEQEA